MSQFSLDYWLMLHVGMTHPDIWMMWLAILLSVGNTVALLRRK